MITAALRMFIELGMVQKFKIDYEVRAADPVTFLCSMFVVMIPGLLSPLDAVQVAADCQKKLQNGPLPQLETCLQRLPVHVCDANGTDPQSVLHGSVSLQITHGGSLIGYKWRFPLVNQRSTIRGALFCSD